jgi:hypothetical protein
MKLVRKNLNMSELVKLFFDHFINKKVENLTLD